MSNEIPWMLDLSNWHPGDPHVHSGFSKLDLSKFKEIATNLNIPVFSAVPSIYEWVKGVDAGCIDGGETTLQAIANQASTEGRVRWIFMTEHGPMLGLKDGKFDGRSYRYDPTRARETWERAREETVTVGGEHLCLCCGEELGTSFGVGHVLAYGLKSYLENHIMEVHQEAYIKNVERNGGRLSFCFIAHPTSQHQLYRWRGLDDYLRTVTRDSKLRGFELVNGRESAGSIDDLLRKWDEHLKAGSRPLIIGGTDSHEAEEVGKKVRTYVFVPRGAQLNQASITTALYEGISVVAQGEGECPIVVFNVENINTKEVVGIGGEIEVRVGDELALHVRYADCTENIRVVGFPSFSDDIGLEENTRLLVRDEDSSSGYLRLESYGNDGICYTNPVFIHVNRLHYPITPVDWPQSVSAPEIASSCTNEVQALFSAVDYIRRQYRQQQLCVDHWLLELMSNSPYLLRIFGEGCTLPSIMDIDENLNHGYAGHNLPQEEVLKQAEERAKEDHRDLVEEADIAFVVLSVAKHDLVQDIVDSLGSKDADVQNSAEQTLVQIGIPAVRPLMDALKSVDSRKRDASSNTLVHLGHSYGKPVVERLIDELRGSKTGIRRKTKDLFGRLESTPRIGRLAQSSREKLPVYPSRVLKVLVNIGTPSIPAMETCLDDSSLLLQNTARRAIAEIKSTGVE